MREFKVAQIPSTKAVKRKFLTLQIKVVYRITIHNCLSLVSNVL